MENCGGHKLWKRLDKYFDSPANFFYEMSDIYEIGRHNRTVQESLERVWDWVIR